MSDRSFGPHSRGVYINSAEDVEEIGDLAGFDVTGWERDGVKQRKIDVKEPEGSERLKILLGVLEGKYGFKPSRTRVVPKGDRDHVFGLIKHREFSAEEIEVAELLHISYVKDVIGTHRQGTVEDVDAERFVVERRKKKKTVVLGIISPFLAVAVTGEFKADLEQAKPIGLKFEPVINGDDIWKLSSSVTMPQCQLPIVNGQGEAVDPYEWTERWSDKYYDDNGYEPAELRYKTSDITQLGTFDIAITAERTGGYKETSFRRLVVSQKFRALLENLGAKGIRYTPVRIS